MPSTRAVPKRGEERGSGDVSPLPATSCSKVTHGLPAVELGRRLRAKPLRSTIN